MFVIRSQWLLYGNVSGNTLTFTSSQYNSSETTWGIDWDDTLSVGEDIWGMNFVGYTALGDLVFDLGGSIFLIVLPGSTQDTNIFTAGSVTFTAADLPVCFLRGTLILTARGEVPVERLRAGDFVVTRFGGLRPIRWIGVQHYQGRFAGRAHQPIRFASGSLGPGVPSTELRVSPGHAMLVGTVLVHAQALVNGTTITQERHPGAIDYFHLDLGAHDCVLANSAWAESYFEDHNRDSFHNAASFHAQFPGHVPERQGTCLPVLTREQWRMPLAA
jgi:hypothetical protein